MVRKQKQQFGYLKKKLCVICEEVWFVPNSPSHKYCDECKNAGKIKEYRSKLYNYGTCQNCGRKIRKGYRWCNNITCQKAKRIFYRKQSAANKKKRDFDYGESHKSLKVENRKKAKKLKYICKRCGEDAYPNRLYCQICHTIVSDRLGIFEDYNVGYND